MFRKEKQFYTFLRNFLAGQEVSSQIWLARYTLVPSSPFWETDYGCAVNLPSKKYNGCPTKRQTALTTISSVLYRLPILSGLCFAALNSSLDVLSWCEVRRAWEIESAKFIFNDHKTADTKLTNKWRHHHRTACFKFHEFLFVQPREKQATRWKSFFLNFLI